MCKKKNFIKKEGYAISVLLIALQRNITKENYLHEAPLMSDLPSKT